MARAPIIISNGGIAGCLAEGLHECKTQQEAEDKLMRNFWGIKDSVVKIIKTKHGHEAFCLYWRLAEGDDLYEHLPTTKKPGDREGVELVSINDLFNPF